MLRRKATQINRALKQIARSDRLKDCVRAFNGTGANIGREFVPVYVRAGRDKRRT